MRIAMTPVFGYLWATGVNESALWVFGGAVATDLIDGFLARYLNQKSRLGALIDPIADKLLMFVSLVVGAVVGVVPVWLAVIVIARDLVLALGALGFTFVWRDRHPPERWRPTRTGKYAMLFQSISILGAILHDLTTLGGLWPYIQVAMVAAAALTIIAGVQYVAGAAGALAGPPFVPPAVPAGERAPT